MLAPGGAIPGSCATMPAERVDMSRSAGSTADTGEGAEAARGHPPSSAVTPVGTRSKERTMIRSILIACAVVAFAGCGGDDDGGDDGGGTPDAAGPRDVEIIPLAS